MRAQRDPCADWETNFSVDSFNSEAKTPFVSPNNQFTIVVAERDS